MVRAFVELHGLLVPAMDELLQTCGPGAPSPEAVSAGVGLLGVWDALLDLDPERENPLELLWLYATRVADTLLSVAPAVAPPPRLLHPEGLAPDPAQAEWLQKTLSERAWPRSLWWRRLTQRARGPLGDRARVVVERPSGGLSGAVSRVLEHLPTFVDDTEDWSSDLGLLQSGDQLTLEVQVPLPGQLAVLHAVGDDQHAEIEVVLPEHVSEWVVRRHLEVVQLCGQIACLPPPGPPDTAEGQPQAQASQPVAMHALIPVWVPEVMPPTWVADLSRRKSVPPEARVWQYRYQVNPRGL